MLFYELHLLERSTIIQTRTFLCRAKVKCQQIAILMLSPAFALVRSAWALTPAAITHGISSVLVEKKGA